MPACCPEGALGAAPPGNTKPRGVYVSLSPLTNESETSPPISSLPPIPCYQVGPSDPHRIVVVFSDVYGVDSGRHVEFCDLLQERLNTPSSSTAVWMPDLFRGSPLFRTYFGGWDLYYANIPRTIWALNTWRKTENVERDLSEIVLPNLEQSVRTTSTATNQSSKKTIGCLGFCYGGWMVGRALSLGSTKTTPPSDSAFSFEAGVCVHPGWFVETTIRGGSSEVALAERIPVSKPILLLPAKQDVSTKPESPVVAVLAEARNVSVNTISVPFEDMDHGFVTRGDRHKDPQIRRQQDAALDRSVAFFETHLSISK